jgi:tRNA1(Val) A37 N6-methylase TrmN6
VSLRVQIRYNRQLGLHHTLNDDSFRHREHTDRNPGVKRAATVQGHEMPDLFRSTETGVLSRSGTDRVEAPMIGVGEPGAFSHDTLLDGRVSLIQPRRGYRVAVDAVLLAAATAAAAGDRVADLGTGVGAAALCLATRVADVRVVGIDLQPDLVALAAANSIANGVAGRVTMVAGDLCRLPFRPGGFDRVMANPPYLRAGAHTPAADRSRAAANGEGDAGLEVWLRCAAHMLRPRGVVTVIHRADRLDEVLALMHKDFGGLVLFPVWPRAGAPARRILVAGCRGAASPARLAPGLVLHETDGRFTDRADAVLRGGCALEL